MSFSKASKWIYSSVLISLTITSVIRCIDTKDSIGQIEDDIILIEDDQTSIKERLTELQEMLYENLPSKEDVPKPEQPEDPLPDDEVIKGFVERLENVEKNIEAIQNFVDDEKETDTFLNGLRGGIGKAFDDDMAQVKTLAESMREELKTSFNDVDSELKAVEDFANTRNVLIGGVLYYDSIGSPCDQSFDVCKIENSECRDGKCQCEVGMSHDSLQGRCADACADGYGSTYQTTNNYIIRGHNSVSLNETSLEECKEHCETEKKFVCRSFDYFPRWQECYLSEVVQGEAENEAWEYNSAGVHFQRDCIVDKQ